VRNIKYRFSLVYMADRFRQPRRQEILHRYVFTYREVKQGASSSLFRGRGIDLMRARYSLTF